MKLATSRRRFLGALGSALVAIMGGRETFAYAATRARSNTMLQELLASPSAQVLGEACLKVPECEQAALQLAVAGDLPRAGELAQRIHDDFARGCVVNVDGWVLSRTEANLYAWAALTASARRTT